ncbi:hypothetical protein L1887_36197 [Cichorium endivia]|nr:hypothetical protein L1887_36197 [Cichorium endivia]
MVEQIRDAQALQSGTHLRVLGFSIDDLNLENTKRSVVFARGHHGLQGLCSQAVVAVVLKFGCLDVGGHDDGERTSDEATGVAVIVESEPSWAAVLGFGRL